MAADNRRTCEASDVSRLVAELEAAELYEQKLHQLILDVRDRLAAGHTGVALSLLNEALTFIDNETDVVAPSPVAKDLNGNARS